MIAWRELCKQAGFQHCESASLGDKMQQDLLWYLLGLSLQLQKAEKVAFCIQIRRKKSKGFSKGRKNAPPKQYEVLNSDLWGKLKCQSKAYSITGTGGNLTNLLQVWKRQCRICCIHQLYVIRWHLYICLAQVVFHPVCENTAQQRHECALYELAGFQR